VACRSFTYAHVLQHFRIFIRSVVTMDNFDNALWLTRPSFNINKRDIEEKRGQFLEINILQLDRNVHKISKRLS